MILSVVVYKAKISGGVIPFTMGLLACVAVILMVAGVERRFGRGMDFLAKYTMPIFLMHTMFAASMRAVLLKLGIGSCIVRKNGTAVPDRRHAVPLQWNAVKWL